MLRAGRAYTGVLDAIARALELDEAERSHLVDLHRAATTGPQRTRRRRTKTIRPMVQRLCGV
ncbi:MAG TPA: hypothetical protein VIW24_31530 [Aldersonia sp.]